MLSLPMFLRATAPSSAAALQRQASLALSTSACVCATSNDTAAPKQPVASTSGSQGGINDLKQASPTGRLLDLFSPSADDSSTALSTPGQPSSGALAGPRPATERLQQDAAAENDMVHVILQAVENCKPLVKVQSINTGARVIHVPKPVTENEQESMAVRWIVQAAQKRHDEKRISRMAECLAMELLLAFRKEGSARLKRDELHSKALENKNNVGGYRLR